MDPINNRYDLKGRPEARRQNQRPVHNPKRGFNRPQQRTKPSCRSEDAAFKVNSAARFPSFAAVPAQEYFTLDNIVEGDTLDQHGISPLQSAGPAMPRPQVTAPAPEVLVSKPDKSESLKTKHAIFGAYCLEDPKCIIEMTLNWMNKRNMDREPMKPLKVDLFNYETLETLRRDKSLQPFIEKNLRELEKWQTEGKVQYRIQYETVNNSLLENESERSEWQRTERQFKHTMIFFNPFMDTAKKTIDLINSFFTYGDWNLHEEGVMILMWNIDRADMHREIDLKKIILLAKNNHYVNVMTLSGKDFAKKHKFTHLKNYETLEKAKEKGGEGKVAVCAKESDHILLFKREGTDPTIARKNVVARAFVDTIKCVQN